MTTQNKQKLLDVTVLIAAVLSIMPLLLFVVKAKQTEYKLNDLAAQAQALKLSSNVETQADNNVVQSIDDVIGKLVIPKIGEELLVYGGTQERSLMNGVGLLEGSPYPGSKSGNSLLTGHRGTHDANIFLNLDQLEIGDSFYFEDGTKQLHYKIYDYKRILPEEVDALQVPLDRDIVTLITCDPYLVNSHRLLFFAEEVSAAADTAAAADKAANQNDRQPTNRSILQIVRSAHWTMLAAALFGIIILVQAAFTAGKKYV